VAIALNSPKTENCAITICAAQKCASSLASKKKEKQKIRKLRQVAWWLLFWHTARKDIELKNSMIEINFSIKLTLNSVPKRNLVYKPF